MAVQRSLLGAIEPSSEWTPSPPPSLDGTKEIAIDFETTGLRWWRGDRPIGMALGYVQDGKIITQYLPWGHRGGNLSEETVKRWAKRELRGKYIKNLHSRFDNHMAYTWGLDLEEQNCVWGDVGHDAALLDDQRRYGFSLEALSQEFLGEGKIQGLDIENLQEYHAGEVHQYAEKDVELVLKLDQLFKPRIKQMGLVQVASMEDQIIFTVCEMERNGAPIDLDLLGRWEIQIEEDIQRCLMELRQLVGTKIDPTDREDMTKLFRLRGIEITHWTAGGVYKDPEPSFKDEVLREIKDEAVQKVRKIKRLLSVKDKYLVPYRRNTIDGILRYSLNQLRADDTGTISGRFSSSALIKGKEEGDGINVQQVMRVDKHKDVFGDDYQIRELYIPEGTSEWLSADAKQVEFRIFVDKSGSARLINEYEKNPEIDFHNIVWDMCKMVNPEFTRKNTKDTNFAQLFGAGKDKTAKMLGIDYEKALEFVELYHRTLPEVKDLQKTVGADAKRFGYVTTVLGRRFHFENSRWIHKALSRIIQGSAADVMKKKLVELHKARKKTGYKMRFTVHDEVNGDSPDKKCTEMVTEILNSQTIPFRVPILWDVGTGRNWKEC
jgi:DNA polymerase-1